MLFDSTLTIERGGYVRQHEKAQKKVALAVPLLGIALVMTLAHPVTFAALVSFAGYKSWRELKALEG